MWRLFELLVERCGCIVEGVEGEGASYILCKELARRYPLSRSLAIMQNGTINSCKKRRIPPRLWTASEHY